MRCRYIVHKGKQTNNTGAVAMTTNKTTLTFKTRQEAKEFSSAWVFKTLRAADVCKGWENVQVEIYDVSAEEQIWIDEYLNGSPTDDELLKQLGL